MQKHLSWVLWAALLGTAATAQRSQAGFQLAPPSPYPPHYVVGAADDDPSATTPEQIFHLNQQLARVGNAKAAFQLGLAYLQGVGTTQNPQLAGHWLAIGAVSPSEKALLGRLYIGGHYLKQDPVQAAHWLTLAGRPGDFFELAEMYRKARPSQVARAATIYRALLDEAGTPEVRRAKLELGGFVLNGTYSAGDAPEERAQNLEWARNMAQELLGQSEYNIAVDSSVGREGIPQDEGMWARFCARAAAYNIDLAQEFYAKGILSGEVPGATPLEAYAWIRLASNKRSVNSSALRSMEQAMALQTNAEAIAFYEELVQTRERDGAYYRGSDPLREPTPESLAAMPDDDPDAAVRRAFALEATHRPEDYGKALNLYRRVRDTSWMAEMAVLGRAYMAGSDGVQANPALARRWLERSVEAGYKPAALALASWYAGQGGGTPDLVQAEAWRQIGGGPEIVGQRSALSLEQQGLARKQYSAWITAHPGWVPTPR